MNEAPWLTCWIETLLVVAVFLVCCTVDMLKCKNGFLYRCADSGYRTCIRKPETSFCDDLVLPSTVVRERRRCSCEKRKSAELLLHVVDVGAPIAGGSGVRNAGYIPIAPLLSDALSLLTGDTVVSDTNGGIFRGTLFEALREEVGLSTDNSSHCLRGQNTFKVFYSHDSVSVPGSGNFLDEVKVSVPFVDGCKEMPGIKGALQELFSRRQQTGDFQARPCMFAHLIVIVVATPGGGGEWTEEGKGMDAAEQLMEVQAHIRRIISRFIRGKRMYTSLLGSVWYVGIPIGFPVHEEDPSADVSRAGGSPMPCSTNGGQSTYSANCASYSGRFELNEVANEALKSLTGPDGKRPGARTIILPYNDYFSAVGDSPNSTHWWTVLHYRPVVSEKWCNLLRGTSKHENVSADRSRLSYPRCGLGYATRMAMERCSGCPLHRFLRVLDPEDTSTIQFP